MSDEQAARAGVLRDTLKGLRKSLGDASNALEYQQVRAKKVEENIASYQEQAAEHVRISTVTQAELQACATEIAQLNEGLDAAKSRLEERVGNLSMAKAKSGHENRMGNDRSTREDNRLFPLTPSTTVQMMQPGFGG